MHNHTSTILSPEIVRFQSFEGKAGNGKNALRDSGSGKGLNDEACRRVSAATGHNSVLGPREGAGGGAELLDAIASKLLASRNRANPGGNYITSRRCRAVVSHSIFAKEILIIFLRSSL